MGKLQTSYRGKRKQYFFLYYYINNINSVNNGRKPKYIRYISGKLDCRKHYRKLKSNQCYKTHFQQEI